MAEGDNEIMLLCDYKSLKIGERYEVQNASSADVAAILTTISNTIETHVYELAGIDTKKIDSMIAVGSGLGAVCSFLKAFKRDMLLPAAQNKSTMLSIAEGYLINRLLTKAGVAFKPIATTSLKPNAENAQNQVAFVGNYKGWLAIKKLGITPKTEAWEIAGILSGINHTIVNKAFEFAGAGGTAETGRKSLGNLTAALVKIDEKNPYLVCKTCEGFGYKPYASPEMLMDEYPDIKPPKVKGRKPKG